MKKRVISSSNKYLQDPQKRQDLIVDAVYSSSKFEGSKVTKKKVKEYYLTTKNS